MSEDLYSYKVFVPFYKGTITAPILAHTHWHAIDKAYTQYSYLQPDRSKYQILSMGMRRGK